MGGVNFDFVMQETDIFVYLQRQLGIWENVGFV